MGGSCNFFIESKFFQLVVEEGERYFSLQIFERGKYFMKSVFMGKNAAQWLMKNIEHIVTLREDDIAYTLQRSSNAFCQFLLLTELKVGGFRSSIIIPEAKQGMAGGCLGLS